MLRLGLSSNPPGFGNYDDRQAGGWRSSSFDVESEICNLRTAVEASARGLSQLEMKLSSKFEQGCRRHVEDVLASQGPLKEFRQTLARLQSESRHLATELGRLPAARDVDEAIQRHRETLEARMSERVTVLEETIERQQKATFERLEGRGGETWRTCLQRMAVLEEKVVLQTDVSRIVDRTLNEVRKAGPELLGASAMTGPAAVAELRTVMRRLEAKVAGCEARLLGMAEESSSEGRIWRASIAAKVETLERTLQVHIAQLSDAETTRMEAEEAFRAICQAAEKASTEALEKAMIAEENASQAASAAITGLKASLSDRIDELDSEGRKQTSLLRRESEALALRLTAQELGLEKTRERVSEFAREQGKLSDSLASVRAEMAHLTTRTTATTETAREAMERIFARGLADLRHDVQVQLAAVSGSVDAQAARFSSFAGAVPFSATLPAAAASVVSQRGSSLHTPAKVASPAASNEEPLPKHTQSRSPAVSTPAASELHKPSSLQSPAATAHASPAMSNASRRSQQESIDKVAASPAVSEAGSRRSTRSVKEAEPARVEQAQEISKNIEGKKSPAASEKAAEKSPSPSSQGIQVLQFVSPTWQQDCSGEYHLVEGKVTNGHGLWKKQGGERWLYFNKDRNWTVGGVSEHDKNFDCTNGFIFNGYTHGASAPHLVSGPWMLFDGQGWREDPDVAVTVVRGSSRPSTPPDSSRQAEDVANTSARSGSSALAVAALAKRALQVASPAGSERLAASSRGRRTAAESVVSQPSHRANGSPAAAMNTKAEDSLMVGDITSIHEATFMSQSPIPTVGATEAAGKKSAESGGGGLQGQLRSTSPGAGLADSILAEVVADDDDGNSWDGDAAEASDAAEGGNVSPPPALATEVSRPIAPVGIVAHHEDTPQFPPPPPQEDVEGQSFGEEEGLPLDGSASWDASGAANSFDGGHIPAQRAPEAAVAQPAFQPSARSASASARNIMEDLGLDSDEASPASPPQPKLPAVKEQQKPSAAVSQSARNVMEDLGFDSDEASSASPQHPQPAPKAEPQITPPASARNVMADLGFDSDEASGVHEDGGNLSDSNPWD